jgi:hypothetical protein
MVIVANNKWELNQYLLWLHQRRKTSIANMYSIGSTNMVITTIENDHVILGIIGQPTKRKEK